jgi:TRAP transporter 4TM/12TM fusion protein
MNSILKGLNHDKVIDFFAALLTLYTAQIILIGPVWGYVRSLALFLLIGMVLAFAIYRGGTSPFMAKINILDYLCMILSVASMGYMIYNYNHIMTRVEYLTSIRPAEYILAIIAVVLILEATRRIIGMPMVLVVLFFMFYAWAGKFIGGQFGHNGFSPAWIVDTLYLTSRGIFGLPVNVVVTLAYTFVLYGIILDELGILKSFMDFANRLFGRADGASAKTAIVSGVFLGMANGMPMSTTYMVGFPTIPEMIKGGYPRHTAGAIAAVAGTAAGLMPPMLGLAAFVLAQYMGVPYIEVCKYTLLPALLFYFAFLFTIHFEAKKFGVKGMDMVLVPFKEILAEGFYIFLISIAVLMYFLMTFNPVGLSALYACVTALILGALRKKEHRMTFKTFYRILARAGRTSVYIAVACAAAGIIIGLLIETGLNLKFASLIYAFGEVNLITALIIAALTIIVLSMGMPSISAYITGIAVFGPALIDLGLVPATVHLFVFYYATLYAITPPVAFAAYAGAQLAETDPIKTGFEGMRLAILTYLIPFIFVFDPAYLLLLEYWTLQKVLMFIIFVIPGLVFFASGLAGFLLHKMSLTEKGLAIAGGLAMISPFLPAKIAGLALMVLVLTKQKLSLKTAQDIAA